MRNVTKVKTSAVTTLHRL